MNDRNAGTPTKGPTKQSTENFWHFPILLAMFVGAFLRLFHLGQHPPNIDETITLAVAEIGSRGMQQYLTTLFTTLDAPIYIGLTVLIRQYLDPSLFALRLLSAMASIASLPLLAALARKLVATNIAKAAYFLATVSPLLVYYGRSARPYALSFLCTLAFTLMYLHCKERKHFGFAYIVLPLLSTLAVGLHYSALGFLGLLLVFELRINRDNLRNYLPIATACILPLLPLLVIFYISLRNIAFSWTNTAGLTPFSILSDMFFLTGTTDLPGLGIIFQLSIFLLLSVPFFAIRKQKKPWAAKPWLYLWLAPILILGALSIVTGKNQLYFPRFFIHFVPYLFLYFYTILYKTRWPQEFHSVVLVLAFFSTSLMVFSLQSHPLYASRISIAKPLKIIADIEQPGDRILVHFFWIYPYFDYHYAGKNHVDGAGIYPPLRTLEDYRHYVQLQPPENRIIVVENAVANLHGDTDQFFRQALKEQRTLLAEYPCFERPTPWRNYHCQNILLFDAASDAQ